MGITSSSFNSRSASVVEVRRAALRRFVVAVAPCRIAEGCLEFEARMLLHWLVDRTPPLDGERAERWLLLLQGHLAGSGVRVDALGRPLVDVAAALHEAGRDREQVWEWLLAELESL